MTEEDEQIKNDKIAELVAELLSLASENSFVTRYLLVGEAVDGEGHNVYFHLYSNNAKPWQILGLLEQEKAFQTAEVHADTLQKKLIAFGETEEDENGS